MTSFRRLGTSLGFAASLLVSSVFVAAPLATASVLRALSLDELCQRADRIVLARVEKIESRWTDDRTAIYSEVTLTVQRSYKGASGPGEVLVVRKEGGSVAGIGMRVYGAAEFSVGEEAVLFTEMRGKARFVTGMTQGKLTVRRTADGLDEVLGSAGGASLLGTPDDRVLRRQPLGELELNLVKVLDQQKVRR